MSLLMRLWFFSSSVIAHAQPSSGARCLILVGPFDYFNTLCLRTAKALARLRLCDKYHNLMSWLIFGIQSYSSDLKIAIYDLDLWPWSSSWQAQQLFFLFSFSCSNCIKWDAAQQNRQSDMCRQWRFRSAWASAQSDPSLCLHEETLGPYSLATHWAHSEGWSDRPQIWFLSTYRWGQISTHRLAFHWFKGTFLYFEVKQIRWVFSDNLGIIFHISPYDRPVQWQLSNFATAFVY